MKRTWLTILAVLLLSTPALGVEVYGCTPTGARHLTPKGFLLSWACAEDIVVLSREHPQPPDDTVKRLVCSGLGTITHGGTVYEIQSCGDMYLLIPLGTPI